MLLLSQLNTLAISADYFVATNGSDSASGARTSPWHTIAKAAQTAKPGDVINVLPGNYPEQVTVPTSGEPQRPISFVSVDARKARAQGFLLNGDYIRIQGFEITNNGKGDQGFGIWAGHFHEKNERQGCEILDNYIHDIDAVAMGTGTTAEVKWPGHWELDTIYSVGIGAGSNAKIVGNKIQRVHTGMYVTSRSLVENNEIDTLLVTRADGNIATGKYVYFMGEHIVFRANYFHGTPMENMSKQSVCFFGGWDYSPEGPPSSDILIENNRCFNATHASEPGGLRKGTHHITYRNNLFVNTVFTGIMPKSYTDVVIVNNTLINCGAYPIWLIPQNLDGAIVKNNLIAYYKHVPSPGAPVAESGIRIDGDAIIASGPELVNLRKSMPINVDLSNNLIWGTNNRNYSPTDMTADPKFVDPDHHDFRLKPGSPAIDSGSDLKDLLTEDLNGTKRPQGKGFDIGAYEFSSQR